jgi:hypothetical protein
MSRRRRALARLLASFLLASPAAAGENEEEYGRAAVAVPATAPARAESGAHPTTRTLERIREWRPTRAYREERAHRAIERFAAAAGPYPVRIPGPAEEAGRKAFDLVPLRIFGVAQSAVSAVVAVPAYLLSAPFGGSEDVTEICTEEPVAQTFRTPLGDL